MSFINTTIDGLLALKSDRQCVEDAINLLIDLKDLINQEEMQREEIQARVVLKKVIIDGINEQGE